MMKLKVTKYLRLIFKLIFLMVLSAGCAKDDKVDRFVILDMAKKIDPTVEPMMAKDLKSGVRCVSEAGALLYGPGCIGAFQVKIGIIDMIALEFETQKMAHAEAIRLDQWCYKNWVFDDVSGEPLLEEFVIKAFGAVRPKLELKN